MARRRPPLWRRLKALLLLLLQPAPATTVLHAPLLSPSLPAPLPGRCPSTNPAALSLLQADVHVRCAATRRPQRGWPVGRARHYMRAAAMATMLHGFPRAKNSLRVDRHARHTASSLRPAFATSCHLDVEPPHSPTVQPTRVRVALHPLNALRPGCVAACATELAVCATHQEVPPEFRGRFPRALARGLDAQRTAVNSRCIARHV